MGSIADFTLIAFLLIQTWIGWRSGLLWQATALASVGLGVVLGLALAPALGVRLLGVVSNDPTHAKIVGFLAVVGIACLTLRLLATWAEANTEEGLRHEEKEELRARDRILGGIFGALKACLLAMVLMAAGMGLWPTNRIWQSSHLAPPLAQAGSRILPNGAVRGMRDWLTASTDELRNRQSSDPNR